MPHHPLSAAATLALLGTPLGLIIPRGTTFWVIVRSLRWRYRQGAMSQEHTLSLESRQVLIGGSPTHYLVGGQGPEGGLLPGGGGDCRQWGPSLPALAENYRGYAPDLPGFGQSPNPRDDWS